MIRTKAKEDDSFLDHANEEHPLSWILLEKSLEIDNFNVDSSTKVTKKEIKREAAEFELVEQNASHLNVKQEYFENTSELDETSVRISSQFNASEHGLTSRPNARVHKGFPPLWPAPIVCGRRLPP